MFTNLAYNLTDKESLMTIEEYYKLCDTSERKWELIEGIPYMMSSPSSIHDRLCNRFNAITEFYFEDKQCVPHAQLNVKLFKEDKTIFIPDGLVLCDQSKDDGRQINGAPDLILEVWSPGNSNYLRRYKIDMYKEADVREIWEIIPEERQIKIYYLDPDIGEYMGFESSLFKPIESKIFSGLMIDYSKLDLDWTKSPY